MLRLCLVLQLCVLIASQKTALDTPENLNILRSFRKWILNTFGVKEQARRFMPQDRRQIQEEIPPDVPFPCNVTGGRSPKVPDSVHRLRPGDIDVIGALGDSLTAGSGIFATNVLQIGIENRGASGSAGGQGNWRTYLTLPNILKEYNPNLIGYALGDSFTFDPASQLNVAEIGAMSKDMPYMAKYLVKKIKKDPRIDVKKHWKLISLFIGSNDFCAEMCVLPSPWLILDAHKVDLINTLRILRDNLPRTLVAIHLPPNLKTIVDVQKRKPSLQCYFTTTMECPCLFALKYEHRTPEYYKIMTRWQDLEEEIGNYPEFNRKDFTVVILPTLKKVVIPLAKDGYADLTYVAPDCFHVSQKSNARYANGLWNNLLEPYDNKTEFWYPAYERFLCPTPERPFLITRENSWKRNVVS